MHNKAVFSMACKTTYEYMINKKMIYLMESENKDMSILCSEVWCCLWSPY
jgi:hypothetical protein